MGELPLGSRQDVAMSPVATAEVPLPSASSHASVLCLSPAHAPAGGVMGLCEQTFTAPCLRSEIPC